MFVAKVHLFFEVIENCTVLAYCISRHNNTIYRNVKYRCITIQLIYIDSVGKKRLTVYNLNYIVLTYLILYNMTIFLLRMQSLLQLLMIKYFPNDTKRYKVHENEVKL